MLHLACKGGATFVLTSQLSAADHLRSDFLRRTAEEGIGQGWESVGDGLTGYGSKTRN